MQLYSEADFARARGNLRRKAWLFGGTLGVLLAVYVLLVVLGWKNAMLAVLLVAMAFGVCAGDLLLLPTLRYSQFLKGLQAGLRRELRCTFEGAETALQMQDGAQVCAVRLRTEDGDSRILYWNASRMDMLPPLNAKVEITSCGRHAVAWRAL